MGWRAICEKCEYRSQEKPTEGAAEAAAVAHESHHKGDHMAKVKEV